MVRFLRGAHHFCMIHPSPALLEAADPSTAFLALRWNEFFDRFTVDSFQPKLCNLPTLVEEIFEVCASANQHQSSGGHLIALQAELAPLITSAHARRWITAFEAWKLDELRKVQTCNEAKRLSKVLLGDEFRAKFEERIFVEAVTIPTILPKQKLVADASLGQLATIALHRGYSGAENTEAAEKFFEKSPGNWMDGLLSRLQSRPQEFLVVVELQPTARIPAAKLAKVMAKGGFKVEEANRFPGLATAGGGILISIREEGTSPAAALQAVLRRAEPILDMLAFYLADRAAILPDRGWVGKAPDGLVETKVPSQSLRLVHPHGSADRLVIDALESNSGARFDGSVSNALELHSTAMHATDVRTRFLNLWAALECLASLVDEPTIAKRVTELVCPIVTWRKVEKLGRYIAINLHLWRKASGQLKEVPKALPNATEHGVPTPEVIAALCKPENHPDILELLAIPGKHSLLRYRICSAWKEFHDPAALARNMVASRERLGWHIKRIYRARNLLVHRGIEVPRLEGLCDNLHYYVSSLLSRVIHGVSKNEGWQPEEAIKHWQLTGNFVLDRLGNQPEVLTLDNLMPITTAQVSAVNPWGHLQQATLSGPTTPDACRGRDMNDDYDTTDISVHVADAAE